MYLSNRLTFSLVFSVLLVAGFALVPTVMAAEGGPTAEIDIDDSAIMGLDGNRDGDIDPTNDTGDDTATPPVPADDDTTMVEVVDGTNVLMTNDARTFVLNQADIAGSTAGEFRVLVTFNQDVYRDSTEADQNPVGDTPAVGLDGGFRNDAIDGDTPPDASLTFTAYPVDGSPSFELTGAVARVDTVPDDGDDTTTEDAGIQPHKRQFLITITVPSTNVGSAPFVVRINIPENAVFSKASEEKIVNGVIQDEVEAIGSQAASMDFTVIPKPLIRPTVVASATQIGLHQTATVTLTFAEAPTGTDMPIIRADATATPPVVANIMVTNGTFLADDPNTADVDEGLTKNDDGTVWTITVVPQAGMSQDYDITVAAIAGAPFVLSETIRVDVIPPDPGTPTQDVTITGTAPADGAIFTATITYRIAPVVALTEGAVSVTNGSKVAGTFAGSGKVYTINIDPNNPTVDNPVTVTVSVGQYSAEFTTSATPPPDPVDPNPPTVITLSVGVDAGGYLVVAPMGATNTGMANSGLPTSVTPTMVDLPNLYDLLFGGGTISVYVTADTDNNTADIIINEVMWARDEGMIGQAGEVSHQWIELYNNSAHDAAGGSITLQFRPKVAPAALTDKGSRTDRLSNIERVGTTTGWRISSGKGQSGNSTEGSLKEFISMYRQHNKRGDNDGVNGGHWHQSTELSHVNHKGTPGSVNTVAEVPVTVRPEPSAFTPPKSHVLINEVHNNGNNDLDWLELRFLQNTNLENWTLSYAWNNNGTLTETEIMRFPRRSFAAGDIVLIVNKGPQDTNLAAGQDVTLGGANQARGAGPHKYWNPSGGNSGSRHYLDIPDHNSGNFLLILRTGKGWERWGSRDRIHDAAGRANLVRQTLNADTVAREPHTGNPGQIWETNAWPLNGHKLIAHNANGSNNNNAMLQPDRNFAVGSVFARNGTNHGWRKDGIYNPGNRGGLGYGRDVVANGTPGYDNGIVKGIVTDLASGEVVVSELMLTTDDGRFPQWVELHNTSMNTVDLHADTDGNGSRQGWSIKVENHRSGSWDGRRRDKLNVEVKFRDLGVRFIPPNQTILITADKVRNSKASHFPDSRVASIWGTGARGAFKMENRRDTFLNTNGFRIEVVDGSNQVSDAVGNLDGKGPDLFNPDNIDFDSPSDNGAWNWPAEDDMVVRNRRTSLVRIYDDGMARMGTPDGPESNRGAIIPIGTDPIWMGKGKTGEGEDGNTYAKYAGYAWVHAIDTKMAMAQVSWYGSEDDYGTPLHTAGTPLPVELSFFRPTLEDGEIVIRWTTESELNNAGFNIYRSDTSTGEFTKVNEQMIQGNGTTGERSTYKWVDTTAKPNAVYYYQIEDVSFAGERQLLSTTKLKGLVSAEDKVTTTWGNIKEASQ